MVTSLKSSSFSGTVTSAGGCSPHLTTGQGQDAFRQSITSLGRSPGGPRCAGCQSERQAGHSGRRPTASTTASYINKLPGFVWPIQSPSVIFDVEGAGARFNANQIGASNFCCCFRNSPNRQARLNAVIRQRGDGAGVSVKVPQNRRFSGLIARNQLGSIIPCASPCVSVKLRGLRIEPKPAEVFTIDRLVELDVASRVISQLGAVNRLCCNKSRVKCAADDLVSGQVGTSVASVLPPTVTCPSGSTVTLL